MIVHRLSIGFLATFLGCLALGGLAIATGAAGLLDLGIDVLRRGGESPAELWTMLVIGALLAVSAIYAIARGRVELDDVQLIDLAFRPFPTRRRTDLARVVRCEFRTQSHGAQRLRLCELELDSGEKVQIRVSMYARSKELENELARRLAPSETPRR